MLREAPFEVRHRRSVEARPLYFLISLYYELLPLRDLSDEAAMNIKPLDGRAVLCEDPGCDRPAVYLFTQTTPTPLCAAYCEFHGPRFAERMRLTLPNGRRVPERTVEAIA